MHRQRKRGREKEDKIKEVWRQGEDVQQQIQGWLAGADGLRRPGHLKKSTSDGQRAFPKRLFDLAVVVD